MAGDWIKIEKITPEKPEVLRISEILKLNSDEIFGKLFKIWSWADDQSVDGAKMPITEKFLDQKAGKKGFASAMRAVGWLTGTDGNLEFPGFSRHNGDTAKARAESNRRMAKSRMVAEIVQQKRNGGDGMVAEKAQQKAQPEKRREEKREYNTPLPPEGGVRERGVNLIFLLRSLRPEWDVSNGLSGKESRPFRRNENLMLSFADEAWPIMKEFLAAKLPEGSPLWQPRLLQKFLESPGVVWGQARAWKAKQRPRLEIVRPSPGKPTDEDTEALREFGKFLKKPEPQPKRMNS